MKFLSSLFICLALVFNLGAMPAMALSMDHGMASELSQASLMDNHALNMGVCVGTANCQDDQAADCAALCLARGITVQHQQPLVILFAILILLAIQFTFVYFKSERPLSRSRVFPPPLYLFNTVRLIE